MNANRLMWIDISKGLGILTVVAGHIYGGLASSVIHIFHIPFFFCISGYLYNSAKNDERGYFSDKAIHLLVPYFSFLLLIYGPLAIAEIIKHGLYANIVLPAVIGGRALGGWFGVFWFVTCLFAVQQSMNILLNKYSLRTVAWTMLLFLAIGYVNSVHFPGFWLPWNLNVVFAACPFFFVGHLAQKIDINHFLPVCSLGALLAVLLLVVGYENTYDMKYAEYGIPVVTLLSAISMIGVLICVAKKLSSQAVLNRMLSKCGEASMVVMFLHQPVQMALMNTGGVSDKNVRFVAATLVSILVYQIFSRNPYSRALLLGSIVDFRERIVRRTTG